MNNQRIINLLLALGTALCLLHVWLPPFFLTGDGPCHAANARILHDLWSSENSAFYSMFYDIIYQPNPNWFATVVMSLLMYAVNGLVAEKLFITLYVLFFTGGFYLLLRKLSDGKSGLLPAIFIFVFTHALFKGFYNFSFSIAFYLWVVWAWLRFMDRRSIANAALFIFLSGLIFFTHLLSFVFAAFTCGALIISYALANEYRDKKERRLFLFRSVAFLALFLAPFFAIMRWFTEKEGGMQIHLQHHFSRVTDLVRFRYMVCFTHAEEPFALAAGVIILLLLCFSFAGSLSGFKVNKYDGIALSLLFVSFVYFFFPEAFLGRLILISLRSQPMVLMLAVCCVAYRFPAGKIKEAAGVVLFGCFVVLSVIRISGLMAASGGVSDIMSSADQIKPRSVVLPLDFSPGGKDGRGREITDRNWLFTHPAQYMGLGKPLVVLDNYEANAGYFPLVWKPEVNPYHYLGKAGSFERQPPVADMDDYKSKTGVTIDYVLMWCFDSSALKDEGFRRLYAQINTGYHKVYTSGSGRVVLYERK